MAATAWDDSSMDSMPCCNPSACYTDMPASVDMVHVVLGGVVVGRNGKGHGKCRR